LQHPRLLDKIQSQGVLFVGTNSTSNEAKVVEVMSIIIPNSDVTQYGRRLSVNAAKSIACRGKEGKTERFHYFVTTFPFISETNARANDISKTTQCHPITI